METTQQPKRRTPTLQGVTWEQAQREKLREARREPTLADLAAALSGPEQAPAAQPARQRAVTHERPVLPPRPVTATALAPVQAELGQLAERVEKLGEVAAAQIEQGHVMEDRFSDLTGVFEQQKRSLDEYTRELLGKLGGINSVPTDVRRLERAITQTWAKQSEKMDQVIGALERNTAARVAGAKVVGQALAFFSRREVLGALAALVALYAFDIVRGLIQ